MPTSAEITAGCSPNVEQTAAPSERVVRNADSIDTGDAGDGFVTVKDHVVDVTSTAGDKPENAAVGEADFVDTGDAVDCVGVVTVKDHVDVMKLVEDGSENSAVGDADVVGTGNAVDCVVAVKDYVDVMKTVEDGSENSAVGDTDVVGTGNAVDCVVAVKDHVMKTVEDGSENSAVRAWGPPAEDLYNAEDRERGSNEPKVRPSKPHHVNVVMLNGEDALRGFHPSYVETAGHDGRCHGLHVQALPICGKYRHPGVNLRFHLYNDRKMFQMGNADIFFDKDDTRKITFGKTHKVKPPAFPYALSDVDTSVEVPKPRAFAFLSIQARDANVFFRPGDLKIHDGITKDIRTDIDRFLTPDDNGVVNLKLVFVPEKRQEDHWKTLCEVDISANPFSSIDDDIDYRDLTLSKVKMDNVPLGEDPVQPVTVFRSAEHRHRLIMAACADEKRYEMVRFQSLKDQEFPMVFLPVAHWQASDTDEMTYGIAADGVATHYLAMVDLTVPGVELLPDVDEPCSICVLRSELPRPIPSSVVSDQQLDARADEAQRIVYRAMATAENARRNAKEELDKQSDDVPYDDVVKPDDREIDAYRKAMIPVVWDYVDTPTDRNLGRSAEAVATANKYADDLRKGSESDSEHKARIRQWLAQHTVYPKDLPRMDYGAEFHGRRVVQPYVVAAPIAFFLVTAPVQSNWPSVFRKPPMAMDLPQISMSGPMRKWLQNVFAKESNKVAGKVFLSSRGDSLQKEATAFFISNAHAPSSSNLPSWMSYTIDFRQQPVMHNWFDVFPGLQAAVDKAPPTLREQLLVFRATPSGKATIVGGPGSGKSSFTLRIAAAAWSGGFNGDKHGQSYVSQLTDSDEHWPDSDSGKVLDAQQVRSDAGLGPSPVVPSQKSASSVPNRIRWMEDRAKARKGTCRTQIAFTAPQHEQVDDMCARIASTGRTPLRVYTWDQELKAIMRPSARDLDLLPVENLQNGGIAHLNKHLNDAKRRATDRASPEHHPHSWSNTARRIAKKNPDQYVEVLRGWSLQEQSSCQWESNKTRFVQEYRNLLTNIVEQFDAVCGTPVALRELANKTKWACHMLVIDEAGRMSEPTTLIPMSVWPNAMTILAGDVRQFAPIAKTLGKHATDLFPYSDVFGSQREVSLLQRFVANNAVDLVLHQNYRAFGTVADWANQEIYDDRMTVVNAKQRLWPDIFTNQLRSRCSAVDDATVFFDMESTFESRVGTSFINIGTAAFTIQLAILVASWKIPNMSDVQNGVANPRLASILITSPYKQQVEVLRGFAYGCPAFLMPSQRIDIRTLDTTPSHEAEIVIVDLVRTTRPGFLTLSNRLAVMMTRSRISTLLVGSSRVMSHGLLRLLIDDVEGRKSLVRIPGWETFCALCTQPGHKASQCTQSYDCSNCKKNHSIYKCPVVASWDEPKTMSDLHHQRSADDGVDRDIFNGFLLPSSTETAQASVARPTCPRYDRVPGRCK